MNLFLYYIVFVVLFAIFYRYYIDISYIFPFILGCMFIYFNEKKLFNKQSSIDTILMKINKPNWRVSNDIVLFLDDVYYYRKYNARLYDKFISDLDTYFATEDQFHMLECLNTFHDFIHTLPIDYGGLHTANMHKLDALIKKDKEMTNEINEYRYYV